MTCFVPKHWYALLVLTASSATAAAPTNLTWSSRAWQAAEGLPDNTVVGTEQTSDGFLWVATQGGLVRFDGVRFQEFSPAASAGEPTTLIQALGLDRRNRLWFGKDRGVVACVDAGRITAFTASNGIPLLEVRLIIEDAQGGIWVSYLGGEVVRIHEGRIRRFKVEDGLPQGGTCQLATGADGRLWFAKANDVGVFRNGRFLSLTNFTAQRITAARNGGIWACTGLNLFRYREGEHPEFLGALPTDRFNVTPTVLFEDRSGALWIGTRNAGLFRYDGSGFASVKTSHPEILSVGEDREGSLWIGTRGGGLNRLRPSIATVVDVGSGVSPEAVRSVSQDTAGVIWATTQSGAVVRKQERGWTPLTARDGWPEQYAQCVAADPGGGIWIGTQYKGLHRLQDGVVTSNFARTNGLAGNFVNALHFTPGGDLWVGTESSDALQHAVQRRRAGEWQTFNLPGGSGLITAMVSDSTGRFWAATSAGLLLRFNEVGFVNETPNTLTLPHAIRCLLATSDGSLWVGYAGRGVGRLKGGVFELFERERGLREDYISQIVTAGLGRLWFAGNQGIFYVKQTDFDDYSAGRIKRVRSVAYGRNDGLPGTQASYGFWPGALAGVEGRLWIPMQSGLAVMNAAELKENPFPPPVLIERVSVDNQVVTVHEFGAGHEHTNPAVRLELKMAEMRLRLRPGYQRVQFEFTALSFVDPSNVEFKYQLHPLDADWVDAGSRRVADYPHIPPGDYQFRVIACNDAGVWSKPEAVLAITAEPHFWETTWFQIAAPASVFALLGSGVLLAVRQRHRRQIERLEMQRATERERARIAQDLHDNLGAGLTQISLNTALAQNPAVAPQLATGLLQEIDQRARELVLALDEIVWAVQPKNDTVPSLARYLCQFTQTSLLPTNMACRLEVSPRLSDAVVGAAQRHHLFLAFKEALHNVIQHSKASEVRLEISTDARTLTVTLVDNGCGFLPGSLKEGADGLENMRARLERVGGNCGVTTDSGKGTVVGFSLPLNSKPK